jgi:hypothetical protein
LWGVRGTDRPTVTSAVVGVIAGGSADAYFPQQGSRD